MKNFRQGFGPAIALIASVVFSISSYAEEPAGDDAGSAAAESAPVARPRPPAPNYVRRSVEPGDEWKPDPRNFRFRLGYEGASGTSIYTRNAVDMDWWFTRDVGVELLFGLTKAANTTQVQTATAENPNAKTKTVTTTYSGTANPNYISLGGGPKWRLYQNKWFTVTAGAAVFFTIATATNYDTNGGTHTVTTSNTDSPDTYTLSDNGKGTTKVETSPAVSIGPRIGATAFLPFFPNLAIGFNAGILGTFGGGTKTTTSTTTSSQTVTGGTAGTTVITAQNTTITEVTPGMTGATTAIGGTGLGFSGSGLIPFTVTGTFTISYCW